MILKSISMLRRSFIRLSGEAATFAVDFSALWSTAAKMSTFFLTFSLIILLSIIKYPTSRIIKHHTTAGFIYSGTFINDRVCGVSFIDAVMTLHSYKQGNLCSIDAELLDICCQVWINYFLKKNLTNLTLWWMASC